MLEDVHSHRIIVKAIHPSITTTTLTAFALIQLPQRCQTRFYLLPSLFISLFCTVELILISPLHCKSFNSQHEFLVMSICSEQKTSHQKLIVVSGGVPSFSSSTEIDLQCNEELFNQFQLCGIITEEKCRYM